MDRAKERSAEAPSGETATSPVSRADMDKDSFSFETGRAAALGLRGPKTGLAGHPGNTAPGDNDYKEHVPCPHPKALHPKQLFSPFLRICSSCPHVGLGYTKGRYQAHIFSRQHAEI